MPKQILIEPQKFSEYFHLDIPSDELPFLNIYASQDIPLFLDPYGISAMGTAWSSECEQHIKGYFQYLVDSIRMGDNKSIQKLLNALHEVDEVSLGYSSSQPSGRGIGAIQAREIQTAFENSEAAKSGDIKDIADCALMIPGINRDKISDITANILKRKLIEFTQAQCKEFSIPMKRAAINNTFNYSTLSFTSFYAELPIVNGRPKILLPISSVRRDPQLSKDRYYRSFVIEFLRAEHEHAGDALSTVLKNGRIVVRIGDLKERFPLSADFLYKFSKEHPNILEKYKSELRVTAINKSIPTLEPKRKVLTAKERIELLSSLRTGNDDANSFHKLSYDNLIQILGVRLSNPDSEVNINNGRKRIDIVFDNTDRQGFFRDLNELYHIRCPKIFIECKNYGGKIANAEVDQIAGRFSNRRGMFGIILCREVQDRKPLLERCRDIVHADRGFIIVLDDKDIATLLNFRANSNELAIDSFLKKRFDELIM